jgi:hypothetical protein
MSAGRGRGPGNAEAQRERREQRPTKFPRPRYESVIKMHPDRYNWLPVPGAEGVERKFLGSFTERAFWIDMIKIEAGASWTSSSADARRLTVVLSGSGTVEETKIARLGAVEAEAGEDTHYTADEDLVLYTVGLPPIQLPRVPSDQFDEITTDGGIEFENPANARNG